MRDLTQLKVIYFISYAAAGSLLPFLPFYFTLLRLPPHVVGFLPVVQSLFAFGGIILATMADKHRKHKSVLMISMVCGALLLFSLTFSRSILISLLLSCLASFVSAPIVGLVDTAALRTLGSQRINEYSSLRLWGAIGHGLTAVGIRMPVSKTESLNLCFIAHLLITMVGVTLIAKFSPKFQASVDTEKTTSNTNRNQISRTYFWDPLFSLWFSARSLILFFAIFIFGNGCGVIYAFVSSYLREMNAPEHISVIVMAVRCISDVLFLFFSYRLLYNFGAKRILYLSMIAMMLKLILYSFVSIPFYIIPMEFFHGLSWAVMWSACVSYSCSFVPPELTATMLSTIGGLASLGQAAGNLAGSHFYSNFGPVYLFWISSGWILVGLLFFVIANEMPRLQKWKLKEQENDELKKRAKICKKQMSKSKRR